MRLFESGSSCALVREVVLVSGFGQQCGAPRPPAPGSVRDALDMILAGFAWLAETDVTSVPAVVQAECLRELERVRSVQTAAQASVLAAFDAGCGYEDDACRSPRSWLMWQTRVTGAAASASVGWERRLRAHPAVAAALRSGVVSTSWARQVCDWSDALPGTARGMRMRSCCARRRAGPG